MARRFSSRFASGRRVSRRSLVAIAVVAMLTPVGASSAVGGGPLDTGAAAVVDEKLPPPGLVESLDPSKMPFDAWGLGETLEREHPDSYAGVYYDDSGDLVVAVVGGDEARIRSTVAAYTARTATKVPDIQYAPAQHSMRSLRDVKEKVTSSYDQLKKDGVTIAQWGVDPQTNRVFVGLPAGTDAAEARVVALTGEGQDVLEFRTAEIVPATATNRWADVAAWNAGDFIVNTNAPIVGCSTGFGVHNPNTGHHYLVTAAHCSYIPGLTDFFWNALPNGNHTGAIGFSTAVSLSAFGFDTQLIDAPSSTITWTAVDAKSYITASFQPVPNDVNLLINEGAVSGPMPWGSSTMTAGAADMCQTFTYPVWGPTPICHLWSAFAPPGFCATREGDSGGPIVSYSAFGPLAVGSDIGGNCNHVYFHTMGVLGFANPYGSTGPIHVNTVSDPG